MTAFAQLADDVRALSNYVPDNTFIPGFFMDVPGDDTTPDQLAAITDPAVDLGTLPPEVFQTFPFQVTMSLLNPWGGWTLDDPPEWWGGELIPDARLRITIDDPDEVFVDGDVTATAADLQQVPFSVDDDGDLVGWWGPATGFPVPPGYNASTTFDVEIADGAPLDDYGLTLELVTASDPDTVLAAESGVLHVNENVATVLWGDPLPKLTAQASVMQIPLQVYAPAPAEPPAEERGPAEPPAEGADEPPAVLDLTITGPGDDSATVEDESLAAGDVTIYGSNGSDMVPLPLTLAGEDLVGAWNIDLVPGYNPVTWYVTVAAGAPVGNYAFGVSLRDGNVLAPLVVAVAAPPTHGEQPGEFAISITPVGRRARAPRSSWPPRATPAA